jgi:CheY-like chemotaxis protein
MKRVLVVDDDSGVRDALVLLLSLEGYAVETASDATEAIASAGRIRPDIVLCDITLGPGGDGCSVARAIRADERLALTRLVALSGTASEQAHARAAAAGFEIYLHKPIAAPTLLAELARAGGA